MKLCGVAVTVNIAPKDNLSIHEAINERKPWDVLFINEQGAYVETRKIVPFSTHRHLLAKSARIIGINNHPSWDYVPSMKLIQKYNNQFPF